MTCKKPYTKIIQRRIRLLWLALFGMLVFMVVIGVLGLHSSKVITGFAYDCGNFLYWCGLFYIIGRIIINKKLLKDRLRLKEQQLRERDEWRQHLHRMSGGWVMDAMLVLHRGSGGVLLEQRDLLCGLRTAGVRGAAEARGGDRLRQGLDQGIRKEGLHGAGPLWFTRVLR